MSRQTQGRPQSYFPPATPPGGGFIKAYRKGPVWAKLLLHIEENPHLLELSDGHYLTYNNNDWIKQTIDHKRFTKFYQAALEVVKSNMAGRKETRWSDQSREYDLNEDDMSSKEQDEDEEVEEEDDEEEGNMSAGILKTTSRYDSTTDLTSTMSRLKINKDDFALATLNAKAVMENNVGWFMIVSNGGGRPSDSGSEYLVEMLMVKLLKRWEDLKYHKLRLIEDKDGKGKCSRFEDKSPSVTFDLRNDLELLAEKAFKKVKKQNQLNPNLEGRDVHALEVDMNKSIEVAVRKQVVKDDDGGDFKPKVDTTTRTLPNNLKATNDWQSPKHGQANPLPIKDGNLIKYPVKLNVDPIAYLGTNHKNEEVTGFNYYMWAIIAVGKKSDTLNTSQQDEEEEIEDDIDKQYERLRKKKSPKKSKHNNSTSSVASSNHQSVSSAESIPSRASSTKSHASEDDSSRQSLSTAEPIPSRASSTKSHASEDDSSRQSLSTAGPKDESSNKSNVSAGCTPPMALVLVRGEAASEEGGEDTAAAEDDLSFDGTQVGSAIDFDECETVQVNDNVNDTMEVIEEADAIEQEFVEVSNEARLLMATSSEETNRLTAVGEDTPPVLTNGTPLLTSVPEEGNTPASSRLVTSTTASSGRQLSAPPALDTTAPVNQSIEPGRPPSLTERISEVVEQVSDQIVEVAQNVGRNLAIGKRSGRSRRLTSKAKALEEAKKEKK